MKSSSTPVDATSLPSTISTAFVTSPTSSSPPAVYSPTRRGSASAPGDGAFSASPVSPSASSTSSDASSAPSSLSEVSSPSPPPAFPRVVYGPGTVTRLAQELGRLHLSKPLVVSSPSRISLARRIQTLIPNLDSRILDSAVVSVPPSVVDDALDRITDRDAVVSVGGASAVGLASAISCRKGIPHICIPTTYSGSEMMPPLLGASSARHLSRISSSDSFTSSSSSSNLSNTAANCAASSSGRRRHQKRPRQHRSSRQTSASHLLISTVRDPRVPPAVVIYDEELTASSLTCFSAPSATVALARSAEARACPTAVDDTAPWSYLCLPGV